VNHHYTYYTILALSLIGPLALSFDKKVAYYTRWKYLFPAIIVAAIPYLIWDSYFTSINIWRFNADYIVGPKAFHLPVEEWLFFVVVPFCSMFIYECIKKYFPSIMQQTWGNKLLQAIGLILLIAGGVFYNKMYTALTFIFCGGFIAIIYIFKYYFKHFNATLFLTSYAVILIPFLIVNGFLTALPVLIYNNQQNLGIRIYTIPFEDVFYGMLLMLIITAFYEKFSTLKST
jgi:lycopene cyclase domain-containing protein